MKFYQRPEGFAGTAVASSGGTTPQTIKLSPGYYLAVVSSLVAGSQGVVILRDQTATTGVSNSTPFGGTSNTFTGFLVPYAGEGMVIRVPGTTQVTYEVWSGSTGMQIAFKQVWPMEGEV